MWICARCGTQAQVPDMCSGCGSMMRPFDAPVKEVKYQFVLIAFRNLEPKGIDCYGPFPNVMAADDWWDANAASRAEYGWKDYEVVLMEAPNDRTT